MRKMIKGSFLFFFILFLAGPVLGQEEAEEILLTEELEEGVIVGDVVSLDAELGTITIKPTESAQKTFSVVGEETILWKGIEDIELADIKTGEEAEIGYYTDESGKLIASWVDVMIEEEVAPLEIDIEATTEAEPEDEVTEEATEE